MKLDVILLGAGTGRRYDSHKITYKPLLNLGNKKIWEYTFEFFERNPYINNIILVVPRDQISAFEKAKNSKKEVIIVEGGSARELSLLNGLLKVSTDKVIIHDLVRPFLKNQFLRDLIDSIKNFDSVSTAIPSVSTVAIAHGNIVEDMPLRENLFDLQTPQAFDTKKLIEVHNHAISEESLVQKHKDPSRLMYEAGYKTLLVEGSPDLFKITYRNDIFLAEKIVSEIENSRRLAEIPEVLEEFKKGKPVILIDDEGRENEGDLMVPAEIITPEIVNFMISHCKGLVCIPLTSSKAEALNLKLINNASPSEYPKDAPFFTNMVDANETESGISAYDRYLTIKKIVDPLSKEEDFRTPGHIFPLIAREGGLAIRQGHTEVAVDLCKIGGYNPIAVICEVIKDNGEIARFPDLCDFAEEFNLKISSIEKIQEFLKNG